MTKKRLFAYLECVLQRVDALVEFLQSFPGASVLVRQIDEVSAHGDAFGLALAERLGGLLGDAERGVAIWWHGTWSEGAQQLERYRIDPVTTMPAYCPECECDVLPIVILLDEPRDGDEYATACPVRHYVFATHAEGDVQ